MTYFELPLSFMPLLLVCDAVVCQDAATLYTLWPDGTCADLGLSGQVNTSLNTMMSALVNASNPAAVAASLNQRLSALTSSAAGNSSTAAATVGQVRWQQHCRGAEVLWGRAGCHAASVMQLRDSTHLIS